MYLDGGRWSADDVREATGGSYKPALALSHFSSNVQETVFLFRISPSQSAERIVKCTPKLATLPTSFKMTVWLTWLDTRFRAIAWLQLTNGKCIVPFIEEQAVSWLKSGVQDWFLVFLSLFYSVIASTSLDLSGFAYQFGMEMDLFL